MILRWAVPEEEQHLMLASGLHVLTHTHTHVCAHVYPHTHIHKNKIMRSHMERHELEKNTFSYPDGK